MLLLLSSGTFCRVLTCGVYVLCDTNSLKNSTMVLAGVWLTLVQVYAPTDDRDNVTKEQFYASLQEVVGRAPRGDKVVVMGDLNARVKMWRMTVGNDY